jgi:hypothetical protein
VSYRHNNGDETLRYGFVAQEVEGALPADLKGYVAPGEHGLALIERDNNKEGTYHMAYGELTAPIVKAIQDIWARIQDFMTEIRAALARLSAQIKDMMAVNDRQDREIQQLREEIRLLKTQIKMTAPAQ